MTIHIISLAALSPAADAMRRGVEVECAHSYDDGDGNYGFCEDGRLRWWSCSGGLGHPDARYDDGSVTCPRCSGRGRVRYHDLTTGALNVESFRGREYHEPNGPDMFAMALRAKLRIADGVDASPYPSKGKSTPSAIKAALAAIRPGDVLVHDGTELGARCAEVVARVAAGSVKEAV